MSSTALPGNAADRATDAAYETASSPSIRTAPVAVGIQVPCAASSAIAFTGRPGTTFTASGAASSDASAATRHAAVRVPIHIAPRESRASVMATSPGSNWPTTRGTVA